MMLLCSETVDYLYDENTPTRSFYRKGARSILEQCVEKSVLYCKSVEERIDGIARFTSGLHANVSDELDFTLFGGTEEEIIARGSEWCADVARVGCALCQVAGFPARMAYLVDTENAYSGHVIIEVYRAKVWGAVDPLTNVIYRYPGGNPASIWNLMNNTRLVEYHSRGDSTPYTTLGQFRRAAISDYFVWHWKKYDYTVSKINNYYRSILEMSNKGCPGGLRWLHGEERR